MTHIFRQLVLGALCLAGASTALAGVEVRKSAHAIYESAANFDDDIGGKANADDPAIWEHPRNAARSLILGTLKEGGLTVISLTGKTLQRIAAPTSAPDDAPGRFNNVDIVEGFRLGRERVDIAVVTDRGHDKLRIYRINPDYSTSRAPLTDITDSAAPFVFNKTQQVVNDQRTAYGLAVVSKQHGGAIAVVSQRERSNMAKLELFATPTGKVSYRIVQRVEMPSRFSLPNRTLWTPCQDEDGVQPQFEGMVIDVRNGTLYAAQEQVGVWKISLDNLAERQLIDRVRTFGAPYTRTWDAEEEEYACEYASSLYGGKHIAADAEGLTIAYDGKSRHAAAYLIASSQGDSRFVVYDIDRGHKVLGDFTIGDTARIDGVQHSDGTAVLNRPLGPDFPRGLLVIHDGENGPDALDADGEARENTNFKLVPLHKVIRLGD